MPATGGTGTGQEAAFEIKSQRARWPDRVLTAIEPVIVKGVLYGMEGGPWTLAARGPLPHRSHIHMSCMSF